MLHSDKPTIIDTKAFQAELVERWANSLLFEKLPIDIMSIGEREHIVIVPASRKITKKLLKAMAKNWRTLDIEPSPIRNKVRDIFRTLEATYKEPLPAFEVTYSDGSKVITCMAIGVTLKQAHDYFVGQVFTQPDEVTKLTGVSVRKLN